MATSIDLYYETVWKSKCSSNEKSFLASWQGLSLCSHSMLLVLLITILRSQNTNFEKVRVFT
ncbi:hypothetical protein CRE_20470 [Caenorhabditis remanei]|uniref:Uncharacterized protein n=1 Tax=Caenorhabditis remanei TaxID=31234 RepID=E3N2W8_CAERE|nr:hypothetical protein CRE_20470 [Caenorhabditis remanei]